MYYKKLTKEIKFLAAGMFEQLVPLFYNFEYKG